MAGAWKIFKEEDQNYSQDRDERHSDSYGCNSDSVRMFDSIGIIEPEMVGGGCIQGHRSISTSNATMGVGGGGKFVE